jgi:acetyl esterase/lipase
MKRSLGIVSIYFFVVLIPVVANSAGNAAVSPEVLLLWADGAPDAKGDTDGDKPSLTVYLPTRQKATGTAVVICPGGGYGHIAMDHEGHQVAQWLNSVGIAGVILKYRHRNSGAGYGHPAPLQDAQRAIRMVRSRAGEWNIEQDQVGILGFSAGGHLASSAGTHFNKNYYELKDRIDQISCRPDFMILIYPVISLSSRFAHVGSRQNLLGDNPDETLVESLSNEKQVTPQTPPTFLIHADQDKAVPAENSIYFFLALRKAVVPAEMHIYREGQHGFGLGKKNSAVSNWPQCCAQWLCKLGLVDSGNDKAKER